MPYFSNKQAADQTIEDEDDDEDEDDLRWASFTFPRSRSFRALLRRQILYNRAR